MTHHKICTSPSPNLPFFTPPKLLFSNAILTQFKQPSRPLLLPKLPLFPNKLDPFSHKTSLFPPQNQPISPTKVAPFQHQICSISPPKLTLFHCQIGHPTTRVAIRKPTHLEGKKSPENPLFKPLFRFVDLQRQLLILNNCYNPNQNPNTLTP